MNRRNFSRVFILFLAVVLLICSSLWASPGVSAQDGGGKPKVSSLLDMRIKLKVRHLQSGANAKGAADLGSDVIGPESDASIEKIYIHFSQPPTPSQLSELEKLGLAVYPGSWLPPVGDFSTGFVLALMPVDKLDKLVEKNYVVRLDTAEQTAEPQNDLGRAAMNVGDVWSGGYTGAGVTVAVLDSGLDTTHSDVPTPVASKDYSNYPSLDDTIANTVTGHGTHVTGSVLGRGTLNALYKGSAPGASLVFLKIGNDTTGSASSDAIVYAIRAAVDTYNAKIITMSYGGWSQYHDGSNEECQAVDYAVSHGATVFMSAGNNGAYDWHYSGTINAGSTTDFIQVNLTGGSGNNTGLAFNLVWYDGIGTHNGLSLKYYDASQVELTTLTAGSQAESSRGTENVSSYYNFYVGAGTRYLKVQNTSGVSQSFHIYYNSGFNRTGYATVKFNSPDPNYTLGSPAEADSAIAIGAYVTRTTWTDYQNNPRASTGETLNTLATFSSRGPRVDGGAPGKPNVVAPGSRIISLRDPFYTPGNTNYDKYIIDNDGVNNGLGPANYYVMQGTSMACPLAAGVGALLLSKSPTLTPAQVKNILETTATDKGVPGYDNTYGFGLINASAAINTLPAVTTNAATSITTTSATINGNLTSLGTATTVNVSFEYGLTTGYGSATTPQAKTVTGTFNANITSLSSGTLYHFRAKADGGASGIVYGNDTTFTTLTQLAVTTSAATGIASNSATLNGNLTSLGSSSTVYVRLCYGITNSFGAEFETAVQVRTSTGTFSAALPTNLLPNTTYKFRAKANGNGMIIYGNELTFTTLPTTPVTPTVVTNAATSVTNNSATLNGNLTSLGSSSTVYVRLCYGITNSFGAEFETAVQVRTSTGTFSAALPTNLLPNTTYKFRAKANGNGLIIYGSELTFTTLP